MLRISLMTMAALLAGLTAASAQTPAQRGGYLVNTIMACGNCHTPMGPRGPIMDKAFSGGLTFDEPTFKATAPNITQDRETGIGAWSDDDIKKVIVKGDRPNGVPLTGNIPRRQVEDLRRS